MRTDRTPLVCLVLLYIGFAFVLAMTAHLLPDQVATHFDSSGAADAWMKRSTELIVISVFALIFPLFFVAICYALRFLPDRMINIPNKVYWLDPARRDYTVTYLLERSLWLACIALIFVMAIHFLTIDANRHFPPRLSVTGILTTAGAFIVVILIWIASLLQHFRHSG